MAELFNVNRTRITKHINNIYKDGELDEKSTCAGNAHMNNLGVQIYSNKNSLIPFKIFINALNLVWFRFSSRLTFLL